MKRIVAGLIVAVMAALLLPFATAYGPTNTPGAAAELSCSDASKCVPSLHRIPAPLYIFTKA